MNGYAQVSIVGLLGADAEVRTTNAGKTVTNMRIAVTSSWKDASGNRQEDTLWITAKSWQNHPQFIRDQLVKGAPVAVLGTLREESWEKDGVKQSRITVNVDRLEVFARSQRGQQQQKKADDDIPW